MYEILAHATVIKGIDHPKIELSLFTHGHIVQNL